MKKIFYLVVFLGLICGCGKDINQQMKECFLQVAEHNIEKAEKICGEIIPKDKTGLAEFLLLAAQGQDKMNEELWQKFMVISERNVLVKMAVAYGLFQTSEMKEIAINKYREIFNGKEINEMKAQLKYMDPELAEAINQIINDNKQDLAIYLIFQEDQAEANDGIKYLKELDKDNVINSTYLLGLLHYAGNIVEQDYNKSFDYFSKIKTRYSDAKIMLGIMYFMGHGVEENNLTAYEYWSDAYNDGNVLARLILEYDDFNTYVKKMSGIKMLASKDETYQNAINYISWIKSEKGKQFVHKTTMTPEKVDENMLKFVNLSNFGIDFAVGFTSAYLMSIGAIKESVEIYDNLHRGKKAK